MIDTLFSGPIVQVALDHTNIDDALRIAEMAVKAGVTWLEAGTPLITFAGTSAIGALADAFPGVPVLSDYKTMDGARKYVIETKARGGRLSTVCAVASDATVRAKVEAGRETGIAIVCDLYASPNVAARAGEVEALGVDSVYIHWGADQRNADRDRDPQLDVPAVIEAVSIPVGVATFSAEEGARAIRQGAQIAVIGFPLIGMPDPEQELRKYVEVVQEAWASRR